MLDTFRYFVLKLLVKQYIFPIVTYMNKKIIKIINFIISHLSKHQHYILYVYFPTQTYHYRPKMQRPQNYLSAIQDGTS